MQVPLLDLTRVHEADRERFQEVFAQVLDSGRYVMGPELEAFERECGEFVGSEQALGVSSGTDALLLALMGLGIGPGDEVICPTFTFFASGGCIWRTGARPVFVDSEPANFNIDPEDVARKITPKTKAIMPVHLYGQCVDMEAIQEIAREHRIAVIEDACQAIGAEAMVKGRVKQAGAIGTVGCFSFFPTKNLGGFGDGGLVTTQDPDLAEEMAVLRVHGGKPKYVHRVVGANFRMDALQAALLRIKLPRLAEMIEQRQKNADYYTRAFLDAGAGTQDDDSDRLRLPRQTAHNHTYNQYTVRVPARFNRDAMRHMLTQAGIGTEVYYPIPLHLQECFADLGCKPGDHPVAEAMAEDVMALPIFPGLTEAEMDYVVDTITMAMP